jgi:predicted metal-dependent phosphoesterase TrpH
MAVDLHTHSSYSDGTARPAEVVAAAADRRLAALALTDHDTLDGIAEARRAADAAGLLLIPGVELSVGWNARAMHLLAYWIEPGPGPLQDRLGEIQQGRAARNEQIAEALDELGFDITMEEIRAIAGDGVVGRPHFAVALMQRGAVGSIAEAFDRYLAKGRPAYRPRKRLSAAEAVALAGRSGGVTSVAHPHTVADESSAFEAAFSGFANLGITGVECHYVEYPPETRRRMVAIARNAGLAPTGGSDYHGRNKPGIEVGIGRGDLVVPDEVLEELTSARPR